MTGLAAPPIAWDDLTADQQVQLLTTPARAVDPGAELLDLNLTYVGPLTLLGDDGDVHWLGDRDIHRDAAFTIAEELAWGSAVARLYQIITDDLTGLSARRDLGAFCLHTPDQQLGTVLRLADGTEVTAWDVTGEDRLYLLNRQVGHSYYIAGGTPVLVALAAVYAAAGVTGVLIDSSRSDAVVTPEGMAWPLIVPDTHNGHTWSGYQLTPDDSGDPTTWLRIVNDLHTLIGYRGVWCDEHGYYRSQPYVNPSDRRPAFTFDATETVRGTVGIGRLRSLDQWAAPNRWTFIRSNMPTGTAPTYGDGIYQPTPNWDDGPSSINQRGGDPLGIWPTSVSVAASDQAALIAIGDAQVAADKRATATFQVTTVPFPAAEHFGRYAYRERLFGTVQVQATEWSIPLFGGDCPWVWQEV